MFHLSRNLNKTRTPALWDASHQASRQISEAVAVWLVGPPTWGRTGPVTEAQQEPKEKGGSLTSTFLPDLSFPRQLGCSRHGRILSEVSKLREKKAPHPALLLTSEWPFELEYDHITHSLQIPEQLLLGKIKPPLKGIGELHHPPLPACPASNSPCTTRSATANNLLQTHQTDTHLPLLPGSSLGPSST